MSTAHNPPPKGFRMPAEWAPQSAVWMLWPERPDNWRLGAKPAQGAFVAVARAISCFTPVTLGVSAGQYRHARSCFGADPAIRVVELSSNDAWMRDVGPTFVQHQQSGELRGIDWQFNAWGGLHSGLYFPWDRDNEIADKVLSMTRTPAHRADFVLEGGAIHVDGEGTVLTTEECLLHPNRNPHLSRQDIEQRLCAWLGAEKVLWIPEGIFEDETDGHVDNMACFIRPGEIALAWTDDENDPQHARSQAALAALESQTDARGRSLTVHRLPLPGPLYMTAEEAAGIDPDSSGMSRAAGDRLAASYINFLITNGGIIMPAFDDPMDDIARQCLQDWLPDYEIVTVPGREILLGGGNIHCITQQQPR
ncbi:agmatine deiminase [Natronospirillum operosum]|uniref:Putative agmatine deiminase n=1 Tax=Natronospirillum operosum TaxID=2759953 RepID=A0A4Z0WAA1_9GAMM|nr:agmatine deiminase [Natronospirillum operosum]TGG91457.1 agmatine deiminase [Natronospirillum operosum]